MRCSIQDEYGRCKGENIENPDKGFDVGHPGYPSGMSEEIGAETGKKNGKDIFLIPVKAEKERYGDTDADELRQCQVHEDDPSLEDVDAEIRVDQDQQYAGQKRVSEETEQFHLFLLYLRA